MNRYLIAGLYCMVVFVANLTATWLMPLPLFGFISVGTLFFGATFTLRDYAHHHGRHFVYTMIGAAAAVNVFGAALMDTPLRIIAASFFTILIAESTDTEVYQRLLHHSWMQRVLGSNAVSVPIDSIIFNVLAFAGVFSWITITGIVWGDILIKTIIGILVGYFRVTYNPRFVKP